MTCNHDLEMVTQSTGGHKWVLVLGASSGFGEATALAFAKQGYNIVGVHWDRRMRNEYILQLIDRMQQLGRTVWMFNLNAADEANRDKVLDEVFRRWQSGFSNAHFQVMFHSLAFGSLLPLVTLDGTRQTSLRQLETTSLVMAHSLVSWTQAIVNRKMMTSGGRIFAMTSSGSTSVWPGYGAVSAAKACLEAYIRQLAAELAPAEITANALCAGVTQTSALEKIPNHQAMIDVALRKNPYDRLTCVQDVARAVVALASSDTYWMTGNVIHVDGAEGFMG